jgi:Tol biopolymer transport system component
MRADLKRLRRDASSDRSEVAKVSPRRSRKLVLGIAAAIIVLAAVAWFFRPRKPISPIELSQKRLTFNSSENPVGNATISPDGKYLAYSDPAGIHVKLLSSGEERLIPKPSGVTANADWGVASWFPDSTQLLADVSEPGGGRSVWTVSVLGKLARKLREGASAWDASPDGEHIAFFPAAASGDKSEIWMMGGQGDNPRKVLASAENEWFDYVHWSPDGRRLAYIRLRRTTSGPSQGIALETSDFTGAHGTVVLSNSENSLHDFCWLPDQRIIYSRQETPGSDDANLWQIGIDSQKGAPIGKPKRLTQWAGSSLYNLSTSRDGKRLVLQKTTAHRQVYLGELAAHGTRMNPPRRLTNDDASDRVTAWMPDSKAVLFDSDRNGTSGVFKQGISEDAAEAVTAVQKEAWWPRVSPDGAWIFYGVGLGASKTVSLMRIPASGGVPQLVLQVPKGLNYDCARAMAGLCVVLEETEDGRYATVTAFDPLKGRGKTLRTMQKDATAHFYDFGSALSPDGSTLAIARSRAADIRIRLLSLTGGPDREITVKGWSNLAWMGLSWAHDQKGFYCSSVAAGNNPLLYVDLQGNARVLYDGSNTF